jgi:hypothetical protein
MAQQHVKKKKENITSARERRKKDCFNKSMQDKKKRTLLGK